MSLFLIFSFYAPASEQAGNDALKCCFIRTRRWENIRNSRIFFRCFQITLKMRMCGIYGIPRGFFSYELLCPQGKPVGFVWRSEKGWFILATPVLSSRSTLASDLGCVTLATVHCRDIPEHRRTQEGRPGGCTLEALTHRCEAP